MILKTCFLLVLSVAWDVSGASFSKVFFQTGQEAAPVDYVQNGAPSYTYQPYRHASPEIGQYSAAPVGYEYSLSPSYGYGIPCTTSGCFYPGQTIGSVAQVAPSANIVAYNSQPVSNPVVYSSGLNELPGYQYTYTVVDHHSGDHKVHSELNDGGAVRGGYSFLQPDGEVREIQYVADDAQGFNAIVKNFLPVEEFINTESVRHAPPRHESKSEMLTVHESHHEHHTDPEEQDGVHDHHEDHKNHEAHDHHEGHGDHEDSEAHGNHAELKTIYIVHEQSEPHRNDDDQEARHGVHEKSEDHEEHGHPKAHTEHHEDHEKIDEDVHIELRSDNLEAPEDEHSHEDIIKISQGEHKPQEHEEHQHHETNHKESHEAPPVASHEHGAVGKNVYLSYNDVIKCIQAAMAKANNYPSIPRPTSPLTYLVFNKPC